MRAERTIHVIDDDAAVRLSLERLLGSMGFTAVSYATRAPFCSRRRVLWAAAFSWMSRCPA